MTDYLVNMRKLRNENKALKKELETHENMGKEYHKALSEAWDVKDFAAMRGISKVYKASKARKREIAAALHKGKKMIRLNNQKYSEVKKMVD